MLEGEKPKIMNAVRTRLLQDTLQEALTGQTDPVMKDLQKQGVTFSGSKFKQALDKIGEDKLKAIYGEDRYNNLMEFSKLVQHIGGTSGAGAGKFLKSYLSYQSPSLWYISYHWSSYTCRRYRF